MARKRRAAKRPKGATKTPTAVKSSARAALSVATSGRRPVRKRVAAMAQAPVAVCESDKDLQAMLNVLRSEDEPVKVRLAALQSLGAAAFSVIAFESCRGDYLAALRKVATDPKPELRQRVLGLLMREKDGFAQRKLLEGLKNPDKALVPPEKALQLLSYDVHAEAYAAARAIVSKPPNADAKREALRLLAADATSAPLFEKLLRDKNELREIRQISASALHALRPEKMLAHAREMLLDNSEYDDIQATSLTAITQFGDDKALADDTVLLNSVDRFGAGKAPPKYRQGARRFLRKYGR